VSACLCMAWIDGPTAGLGVRQLCYRPVMPHGAPLVGAVQQTGSARAFVAAGHGVWGVTLGPGADGVFIIPVWPWLMYVGTRYGEGDG
jgi:hypothetical protein